MYCRFYNIDVIICNDLMSWTAKFLSQILYDKCNLENSKQIIIRKIQITNNNYVNNVYANSNFMIINRIITNYNVTPSEI